MAAEAGVRIVRPLAASNSELQSDQIESGCLLCDRVLDLDPAVQLEEEKVAAFEQELDSAEAPVVDRVGECHGRCADSLPQAGIEGRRRRLFEHLLVAPLNRALTFAERKDVSVTVGEELDLDVAGALEVALEKDGFVAERRLRFAARRGDGILELSRPADDPDTASPAASRGLDDQGKADLLRLAAR